MAGKPLQLCQSCISLEQGRNGCAALAFVFTICIVEPQAILNVIILVLQGVSKLVSISQSFWASKSFSLDNEHFFGFLVVKAGHLLAVQLDIKIVQFKIPF